MRIDGEHVRFEYLRLQTGGVTVQVSPSPSPFASSNAPGDTKDAGDLVTMEQIGRRAIAQLKEVFA